MIKRTFNKANRKPGRRAGISLRATMLGCAAIVATGASSSLSRAEDIGSYPAVTDERLTQADNSDGWLMVHHDYDSDGFSPLDQITKGNVSKLKQVWDFETGLKSGHEAAPIVNGDYMFVTGPKNVLFAFQASTGKLLWKYEHDLSDAGLKTVCCDVVNRGVALYGDMVYMATLDNYVVALDAKSGKVVWKRQLEKPDVGFAMTVAPLVVKGKVIVGESGGEYGARAFIQALDAKTGEPAWRFNTVPSPDEPGGDTWPKGAYKNGGGASWLTGSYDPATNSLFWGVGNPGPWLAKLRPGKNLYTDSVLSLDPDTGKLKWYYQYTTHDTWDYDGTNEPILTKVTYKGKDYKALVSASRNGWLYAINREDGKLIYSTPFVHAMSVKGNKDGHSINDEALYPDIDKEVFTCPSFLGGKNWWPMSVDPKTQYAYIPTLYACMTMKGVPVTYRAGLPYLGVSFLVKHDPQHPKKWGAVQAVDLKTGKQKWKMETDMPWDGGMLTTAGGLVFSGSIDGELYAFDGKSGKVLWKSPKLSSGIIAPPTTFKIGDKQYVAVLAGWGGALPVWAGEAAKDPRMKNIPRGGHLYVFAL